MTQRFGFLFPGQGSQFVGMGKALAESFPEAHQVFDCAEKILGYSLSQLCFEGPEEKLTQTLFAQPAIFVTSIAALRVVQKLYPQITPSFSAGLSLGEFTALVAAGSMSFEDGLRLVKQRAEAMELSAKHHPGTMASILGFPEADCQAVAKEAGCEVANLNSPDQIVLSGTAESIEKACQLSEAKGAKRAIRLKVGGAFHSSLMREAKENLGRALKETPLRAPTCVFIPNVLGTPVSDPESIRELLARQLMSPVQWIKTMESAASQGIPMFLEIGPGKVLKGLAKKCQREMTVEALGLPEEIRNLENLFQKA